MVEAMTDAIPRSSVDNAATRSALRAESAASKNVVLGFIHALAHPELFEIREKDGEFYIEPTSRREKGR
jgi:hypothetical protein